MSGENKSNRWKFRPEGSNWGEFGSDDQVGRLNYLTPEKVKQGIAEVHEGISFCLSMPLDRPGGNDLSPPRFAPVIRPTLKNGTARMNYPVCKDVEGATDLICDDAVVLHTQYSTHWDALSHTGFMFDADGDGLPEKRYYNGFVGDVDIVGPEDASGAGSFGTFEAVTTGCAHKLGIEKAAERSIQGRGVMIDLHAHFGREHLAVDFDMLSDVIKKDNVVVEKGDMVCLHTGYAKLVLEMDGKPDAYLLHNSCTALQGRDVRLHQWITDTGLCAIAADNFAVERFPSMHPGHSCAAAPLHEHCLFKLGVHLGELWDLSLLAEWLRIHNRNRFLLTAPPLRLPGATGSPTTPIATV